MSFRQTAFGQTAVKAAKEAGRLQLKYFGKEIRELRKKRKEDGSFVTKADIESTRLIRKIILAHFPEHNVLCEELGANKNMPSEYRWIIDPIDGTHNFIMGNPLFGASIALEYRKEIILGVVYLPVLKRLYYAEKGKGAFCNGKRIRVSNEKSLKCLFVFDAKLRKETNKKLGVLKRLAKPTWNFRVYGAAVYHNILVAEGKAGFNIDYDSHPWDHSAVLLMVEEAGGRVTDIKGRRWTPYVKDYVASNGRVHDKVLKIVKC